MASNLLIKKTVLAMLISFIPVIGMALPVSAESGTAFSYTEEKETVITENKPPQTDDVSDIF